MLYNLHLLRAVAALAVVYFHITSDAGLNLSFNVGSRGVDVFFVISGFIIAYIGTKSPDQFFLRRLIRIVPFYWTATLVVFAAAVIAPNVFRSTRPDYLQLLCSLFFLPRETSYAGMFPTLILGWSLNYEMYFYLVFTAALALSKRLAPALCCFAIISIVVGIDLVNTSNTVVAFYARPLVFEFVFGIIVFYLYAATERHTGWFSQRPGFRWFLWSLLVVSAALLVVAEQHQGFGLSRFISGGIPAFFLVGSALLLERQYGMRSRSNIIFLIGESSYILYLIHPYVIYGVLRTIFKGAEDFNLPVLVVLIVALMALSMFVAVLIHIWFEKPVMNFLRRHLLPAPAVRPQAPTVPATSVAAVTKAL